jgi:hypothetical protein
MSAPIPATERIPHEKPICETVSLLRIELAGFRLIEGNPKYQDGSKWLKGDLIVIASHSIERDGRPWLHVSLSRQGRIPSYDDITVVKQVFVGDDRLAVQVFPPKDEHVNINPNVLHLWACLDGRPLPDFRVEMPNGEAGI